MKKKVCFVFTKSSGLGGAERVISLISNYFAENNIDMHIITLIDDKINYPLDNRITRITIKRKMKKPFHIIEQTFKLRKIFKDFDVIIAFMSNNNIYSIVASAFLKKKVIVSDRGDLKNDLKDTKKSKDSPLARFTFIIEILQKFLYRFAFKVVFQTLDAQAYYSDSVKKKSIVIPNPIAPYLPEKYSGERKKEIVAICRLAQQKNIKMTIDAYAKLVKEYPEFVLIIYGDGPLRQELEEYINKLSLNDKIFLPGFDIDIHNKILSSFMYVSSSDYEGISNSMLEALGMGLPSVVTDCPAGGAGMFVKNNENGVLVPVGDAQAMYEGMKKIIEDDEFREKISENAVKIREEISVDIICQKWLDLMEEA